ncbi:hypothetical protein IEQ34_021232 [Dendrobium chrysotoxum]|uniref:Uncharacterized protein n=1 Tax=Dendrobium chrysotoxum TaxID=161865 RepID=A0AAV7FLC0_DENCH|nr:hypothetical protein IEQ34_021232 [Dendrobium chrysotoxum]
MSIENSYIFNPLVSSLISRLSYSEPCIDWKETQTAHIFQIDLPGLSKEDVKVEVEEGRVLRISGERRLDKEGKDEVWHVAERADRSGKFLRELRLPANGRADAVKAKMENGVLTVTVPKKEGEKKAKAKKIDVVGGGVTEKKAGRVSGVGKKALFCCGSGI